MTIKTKKISIGSRKSLAQEGVRRAIFRNVEVRVEGPRQSLLCLQTRPTVSLCDLSGVILHQK